jgi:hypothetical protein
MEYPETEFEQLRTFTRRWRHHNPHNRSLITWVEQQIMKDMEMQGLWPLTADSSSAADQELIADGRKPLAPANWFPEFQESE